MLDPAKGYMPLLLMWQPPTIQVFSIVVQKALGVIWGLVLLKNWNMFLL